MQDETKARGKKNMQGETKAHGGKGLQDETRNRDFLGTMPIKKLLWKMAAPSIVGVMAYNLYNLFDMLFISVGAGMDAVGGVSVSFPLFIFLSAVSSTLGSGGACVMSRALGEKDYEGATRVAAQTFGTFYMVAIFVTIFGLLFLDELLYAMGITEELLPYAREYMSIILLGAVTSTGFSSLIRAEGDGKYAMYIWVIPVTANVVLDVLFIFGFHWGVGGAAGAMVLSQVISMGMSIYFFYFSGRSVLRLSWRHFIPNPRCLREIILTGLPSLVQMSGAAVSIIVVNRFLRRYGNLPINVYGIVSKINTFLIFPVTGLTQGMQPIIGYNKGAGKAMRVRKTLTAASFAVAGYGMAVFCVTLAFSGGMMRLFTPEAEAVKLGGHVLAIVNAGLVFNGLQYVLTTYLQAVGKKYRALACTACNYVVCLVPLVAILNHVYGLEGIWYALPLSAMMSAGVTFAMQRGV